MEKAGRRRLLLTGFISIAFCNLLMTIVDSILVSSPTVSMTVTGVCVSASEKAVEVGTLVSGHWHKVCVFEIFDSND